jgi:hypothetical protein
LIDPTLLLNIFQSVAESAPVVVEFAILIPNTPVRLLYVRGPSAEREVSDILVATTPLRVLTVHEREVRFVFVVLRLPESVAIFPVAVARFVFVVERLPERLEIFISVTFTRPERVAISAFIEANWPLNVPTSLIRPLITPLSVLTVFVTSTSDPEIVEISALLLLSDPESAFTVLERETRFPLSVLTVLESVEITPDSIDIFPSVLLTTPDNER